MMRERRDETRLNCRTVGDLEGGGQTKLVHQEVIYTKVYWSLGRCTKRRYRWTEAERISLRKGERLSSDRRR